MQKSKLAIPFLLNNYLNDIASEFNIKFDKNKNSFEKLVEFIQEYPETRINIEFPPGDVNTSTIAALDKITDKVYVRLSASDIGMIDEMREKGIKYFFSNSILAETWSSLNDFATLGVTDIYPASDLMYSLGDLREWASEHDINLRIILNHIPSTSLTAGQDIKSFVPRPEDMKKLDKYFDSFEFDTGTVGDAMKLDVYYRVFFQDHRWPGQMAELNDDVMMNYPNQSLIPDYNSYKFNCGRVCDKRVTNHCRKCEQFMEIARHLASNNIIIKKVKEDKNE